VVDPFEQFKGEMQPLPNPFMTEPVGGVFFFKHRYGAKGKIPEDVAEQAKEVSADEDAETVRRVKKVNDQIEDWKQAQ